MGALYHLKQKLVDFCNVIQENVSRTDTVPSSKVVYDLKADTDADIQSINDSLEFGSVGGIGSGGTMWYSGHVHVLKFYTTNYSQSGNRIPEGHRPLQAITNVIRIGSDYTSLCTIVIETNGAVLIQKNGTNQESASDVRAEITWIC